MTTFSGENAVRVRLVISASAVKSAFSVITSKINNVIRVGFAGLTPKTFSGRLEVGGYATVLGGQLILDAVEVLLCERLSGVVFDRW